MKVKRIDFGKKKSKFTVLTGVMLGILLLYTTILFLLLFWGLINSLKGIDEWTGVGMVANKVWFPKVWTDPVSGELCFVVNIKTVIEKSTKLVGSTTLYIEDMVINSILYCVGCAFVGTLVPFVTSYLCAKYDNIVSKIVVAICIATMAIPVVGSEPAAIKLAVDLGLYNHIWGLWVMKANFLGVYFLVFYASFKAQPKAYHEAALIDGASDWKIMTRVSMPLCIGEFFTVLLVHFIQFWNDYQAPLLYMPNKPTISWNTYNFTVSADSAITAPVILMAAIIVMIPVLVIFLIFQKRLLKNLNVGGIKG